MGRVQARGGRRSGRCDDRWDLYGDEGCDRKDRGVEGERNERWRGEDDGNSDEVCERGKREVGRRRGCARSRTVGSGGWDGISDAVHGDQRVFEAWTVG